MSRCRSCDRPIEWVGTEAGKKMPLDLEAVDPGEVTRNLFVVRDGVALAVGADFFRGSDDRARTSHFATCPQAGEWRRS